MTQLKVSRLIEVSKILTTKSGQELSDFVQYVADLAEQVVRTLRNGVSFGDNMDATFKEAKLVSGTASVINSGTKRPKMIQIAQVMSTVYSLDSFLWFIDAQGQTQVRATFTGSPGSAQIDVVLLIIYG